MPYSTIKKWRDSDIENQQTSNDLNAFHDSLMKRVFEVALEKQEQEHGPAPCLFSWFVMGSAGRFEQGIISDQDHGLIFEKENEGAKDYFRKLGKELAYGLHEAGYPYCDGNVMSSNPVWCRSSNEWADQLTKWLEEESFESIRFLLIFYDARVLVGEEKYVQELKQQIHHHIERRPYLMERFLENTIHVKKAVGFFQQFLPETHGSHAGSIDLKQAGFLPYVNAVRLLAMKEQAHATSTTERMNELTQHDLEIYKTDFEKLLHYRLMFHKKASEKYDDIHYLDVNGMDKSERKDIKHILKNGQKLQEYVKEVIKGTLHK